MSQADRDLVAAAQQNYEFTAQFMHYGISIQPRVVWANVEQGRFVAEWLVTEDHIAPNGCIDEGCLGTVTDNTTAMLILSLFGPRRKSVSTSISINAVAPIEPNTLVEIDCYVASMAASQPHATATFRSKSDPRRVYGIGSHTKFFKQGLAETQPRL
ncbi:hypothetical protein GGF46_003536 [Coemansia sp. RSA 552]|nr:hypothetical protein GGF46_003536 [Coemansia sp. RSA 552]